MLKIEMSHVLAIDNLKDFNEYVDNLDLDDYFKTMIMTKSEYNDAKRWGFVGDELKLYVVKERLKDYIFKVKGVELWEKTYKF